MVDKLTAEQLDAGAEGAVLNLCRAAEGGGVSFEAFTPRSLAEHEHATLQLSVLLADTLATVGWHDAGGKSAGRRLRGGQMYLIPSGQPHDFRLVRPNGMVNFHLPAEALAALNPAVAGAGSLPPELWVAADTLIAGLAAAVHREARSEDGPDPLYLDAAWTMLAMHLGRLARPAESERYRTELPAVRLRRVLDFVEASLDRHELRVADMASAAGLSPVHFTRLFTRAMGATPRQFIIEERLKRARALLASGHEPVGAIALRVGYGSHARFSEAFRRRFGLSPHQARRGSKMKEPPL